MNFDTQDLIRQAQGGDRAAFQRVLELHYALIFRVAYRFCGHGTDAEDVAQEVCMALVHKLAQFRHESSFSTWLYRVVVNACRDYQKKSLSRRALEDSYVEYEAFDAAEQAEAKLKLVWLYRAIAQLEPALKETALLVLAETLSHAEAGQILGCAESTISWRMHEVRKQLKQHRDGLYD